MSVGRNDPCPCGSGKKYKNCCLKDENKKQLQEQRQEQFYQDKQNLVEKIGDYLVKQVPIKQYNELKTQFSERTEKRIDKEIEESYFTFWLYFFHRFENGLRGIDWFYKENQGKLSTNERTMTETWMDLKPKFLQAVDQTDDVIIFNDMLSDETYPVSNHEENLTQVYPWMSTISFLEPFDGLYYFNGLRSNVAPFNMRTALEKFSLLQNQTGLSPLKVFTDYFPELIAALLTPAKAHDATAEVAEYSLTYSLKNATVVAEFLKGQNDMRVEEWETDKKEFIWAGNWRICKDNACPSDVTLADAYGNLFLQDDTLIFVGIEEVNQQAMKERLEQVGHALVLEHEEKKVIGTYAAKPSSVLVILDEMVPEYFTFYAQNDLLREIDEPIAIYNGKSIRDLIDTGREAEALEWLKDLEFSVYRQVSQQFEEVEVTADFNTVRRKLNLPLSPFVTGGDHRETTYETAGSQHDRDKIYEDDIPFLQELGFTPNTVDHFYTVDMLRFYKEMISEQSEAESNKITSGMYQLRELLEASQAIHWQEDDMAFWEQALCGKCDTLSTKEDAHTFLSVVHQFFKWMRTVREINVNELIHVVEKMKKDK